MSINSQKLESVNALNKEKANNATSATNSGGVAESQVNNVESAAKETKTGNKIDIKPKHKTPEVKASETKFKTKFERKEKSPGFKTDSAISGSKKIIKERELHRWVPDEDDGSTLESLNDQQPSAGGKWDQFAVNKQKFNVTATYDEHLYTTRINYSDPNFKKNFEAAEKLAKEIESQDASGNMHLAEDRGLDWDDDTVDEEDKYSGVDRRGDEILAAIQKKQPSPGVEKQSVPFSKVAGLDDPSILSATMSRTASKQTSKKYISEIRIESNRAEQIKNLKNFSQSFQIPSKIASPLHTKKETEKPLEDTSSTDSSSKNEIKTTKSKEYVAKSSSPQQSEKSVLPPKTKSESAQPVKHFKKKTGVFSSPLKVRDINEKRAFSEGIQFNMFLVGKEEFEKKKELHEKSEEEAMKPFLIQKPYFTSPTWENTVEKSYRELLTENSESLERQNSRRNSGMMGSPMPHGGPGGAMLAPGFPAHGNPPMFHQGGMTPHGAIPGMPMGMSGVPANFNGTVPVGFVPYRPVQGIPAGGPSGGYIQVQPFFISQNMMEAAPGTQNHNVGSAPYHNNKRNHPHRNKGNKHHYQGNHYPHAENGPPGYVPAGAGMPPYYPQQMGQYQAPFRQPMPNNNNTGFKHQNSSAKPVYKK